MQNISELLGKSADYLKSRGSQSPRLDAELLLAEVLALDRIDLYVHFERPLSSAEIDRYRELVLRRGKGEPVAYILGRAYFHNLTLKVDRSVLIPRPETEHVVEAAESYLKGRSWEGPPAVLDLGTGSGAIAIAIAAIWPYADVTAADQNAQALELARENARTAGVAARISFIESDIFESIGPEVVFDLVVSNPPYIADDEWDSLPDDVRIYEPQSALRGGVDGLDYYRLISRGVPGRLKPGGCVILEIGERQGAEVSSLLKETGSFSSVYIRQDYGGRDRVVTAIKNV